MRMGWRLIQRTLRGYRSRPTHAAVSAPPRLLPPREKGAFTLIELLVVITILTILSAILLPAFARARQKAGQATCLSNLRELGAGMAMYASDYDAALPPALLSNPSQSLFEMSWAARLQPYLTDLDVLTCPSSGRSRTDWRSSQDLLRNYEYAPLSAVEGYHFLSVVAEPFGKAAWDGVGGYSGPPLKRYDHPTPSRNDTSIARPADTILLCDASWFDWGFSITDSSQDILFPAPRHMTEPALRQPDGTSTPEGIVNCLFADGHARGLKHDLFWEIRRDYPTRYGVMDVFWHFWPDD